MNLEKQVSSLWHSLYFWFARQLNDQKPQSTIAALDGVRAMAFLLVLSLHINHSGLWDTTNNQIISSLFDAGRTGVTLFFVLSGFLLFLPYTQALLFGKAWPQAKIYYIRRVLRIFPGYFFSLFILIMFTQPYFIQPHNWKLLLSLFTFTMSYNTSGLINGPYWTLAVEFQYYLILPLIALALLVLTRLVRPEKRLWMVVGSLFGIILSGLMASRYGAYFYSHPDQTVLVPRSVLNVILFIVYGDHGKYLEYFAVGMLVAVTYLSVMNSPRKEHLFVIIRRFLFVLLIPCSVLFLYAALPDYTPLPIIPRILQFRSSPWLNEFAFVLCYGYLITAVLFHPPGGWLTRIFSWTPLRWLGLISYSLYIWHRPLVLVLAANLGKSLSRLNLFLKVSLFWAIALTVIVTFCFFLFVLIEKPGMLLSERLRQKILQKQKEKRLALLESLQTEQLSAYSPHQADVVSY